MRFSITDEFDQMRFEQRELKEGKKLQISGFEEIDLFQE
jgi:hypothetical protein